MNRKAEIISTLDALSGKYSKYEVYSDWIRCMALAISNAGTLLRDKTWKDREKAYLDTMARYSEKEQEKIFEMTAYLIDTLEEGPDDVLGDVYMKADMGSKSTGQFFTPFHLSLLNARIGMTQQIDDYRSEKIREIRINEPACGGGAMIIAAAKILKDEGINYQKAMNVVAQDLDWKGVYMCYVQLSLLGIKAICVQGDTLADPYIQGRTPREHILITPAKRGMLL